MSKSLVNMSLEELWELFPISLTEHQTAWKQWYDEEAELISDALDMVFDKKEVRISHIGSTAIKGIWAKPIIDILVEISPEYDIGRLKETLAAVEYIVMSEQRTRISLNKGYTAAGFAPKVYHLHIRYWGDNDELYFRDYLNEHPQTAKQYEDLKLTLWKQYEHNRDGYTEAKAQFVAEYTKKAKKDYMERYA